MKRNLQRTYFVLSLPYLSFLLVTFGLDDDEGNGQPNDFRGPPILNEQPFGDGQNFKMNHSSGDKFDSQGKQSQRKPKLGLKLDGEEE